MTRLFKVALAGLCAGLLLIIAAELFVANQEEFQSAEVPPRTPDASKAFRPAFDMESAIAIILERPLFSPNRDLPDPTLGWPQRETSENAPPQLGARLAGVMIRPGVREALFARAGQKPIPVKIGGEIDGWTIAVIEFDRVVLANDFGSQIVRPTPGVRLIPTSLAATSTRGAMAFIPGVMSPPRSSQPGTQVEK